MSFRRLYIFCSFPRSPRVIARFLLPRYLMPLSLGLTSHRLSVDRWHARHATRWRSSSVSRRSTPPGVPCEACFILARQFHRRVSSPTSFGRSREASAIPASIVSSALLSPRPSARSCSTSSQPNQAPNHALQRTAPGVTPCSRPPCPRTARPRRPPQSLSLGSLGDFCTRPRE